MHIVSTTSLAALLVISIPAAKSQEVASNSLKCETASHASAPKYRVARKIRTTTDGLIIYINISKYKFTRAALASLACRVARDFPEENVLVDIFDDFDSAKRYVAPWQQEKPAGWKKYQHSLRATYLHDVRKNEHWVWWDTDSEKHQDRRRSTCVPTSRL